ncbi:MAG: tetratricopeptide repeat protein, partial [Candidatus Krumholzibacteriota bacterium]|nr:tetratricopeptide repeat protein [Candidatus Krumholzibacteriota bacterium]
NTYANQYGFELVILRPANVYGVGHFWAGSGGGAAVQALIEAGIRGQTLKTAPTRDFEYVYAKDVGRAIDLAATVPAPAQRAFNVGNGEVTTFGQLVEAAKTASDSSVVYLALKNLGVSYQKVKRWRDAEQVWLRMLQRFPDSQYSGEAALNSARCRMDQGDYSGAISAYTEALPLLDTESRARAFYWMGTSYEQLEDYQSAVVEYLKVSYLASGGGMWVVTAQLKAAECYVKIDRDQAARKIYNKVIRAHGASSNWGKIAQKGIDGLSKTAQSGAGGGER